MLHANVLTYYVAKPSVDNDEDANPSRMRIDVTTATVYESRDGLPDCPCGDVHEVTQTQAPCCCLAVAARES